MVRSSSASATKISGKEMPQIPLDLVPLLAPRATIVDSSERDEIQAIRRPALAPDSLHRPQQGTGERFSIYANFTGMAA